MKALLDTNAFLWLDERPERLGDVADTLAEADTDLLVSAVVSWEIAIKFALGRLRLRLAPDRLVPEAIRLMGARAIAVEHRERSPSRRCHRSTATRSTPALWPRRSP